MTLLSPAWAQPSAPEADTEIPPLQPTESPPAPEPDGGVNEPEDEDTEPEPAGGPAKPTPSEPAAAEKPVTEPAQGSGRGAEHQQWGYPYPKPEEPPQRVDQETDQVPERRASRAQLPADAALRATPYLDITATAFTFADRLGDALHPGVQLGTFAAGRLVLAGRFILFLGDVKDDGDPWEWMPEGYSAEQAEPASFMYGAMIGLVPREGRHFVLAPGLTFWRLDVSDYGTLAGLAVPFTWVTNNGTRIGFEFDLLRGMGGTETGLCTDRGVNQGYCTAGEETSRKRPSSAGFYIHFQVGWGLDYAEPQPE